MIDLKNVTYKIKEDIDSLVYSEKISIENLSKCTKISKATLESISDGNPVDNSVCEKFYSYVYEGGYRLNLVKEEFLKETDKTVLFHGSKFGLTTVDVAGSRKNCDFGQGFYLGETFESTVSLVCENEDSCVYSFEINMDGLNVIRFGCTLEWMLAICYFRGRIKEYESSQTIRELIEKINAADIIVAPIADNRMFYIMSLFSDGDINHNVAIHSLSASSFGNQYVIKTEKALKQIKCIEKYYVCAAERRHYINQLDQRTYSIDTKLKLAKRKYTEGKYIEEIFK
ncbi:MAG: DUF3990 domain-containing protein [Bacilli bacterium]|nr:DUF3990 domain-containing protein [Bacilli bacterium]